MKYNFFFILTLLLAISSLTVGCEYNESLVKEIKSDNYSSSNTETTELQSTKKHNIVRTMTSEADYGKLAQSLDELIEESTIIADIEVIETKSFVPDDSVEILTEITPRILKCYKGDCDNSPFIVYGGYMKLKDYTSAKRFQSLNYNPMDKSNFNKDELEEEIFCNSDNSYIPEAGDRILFFGKKSSSDDAYHSTFAFQGLFVMKDGSWQNQALQYEDEGFTEPLVKDIMKKNVSAKAINKTKDLFNTHNKIISVPANKFTDKITELIK